MQELAPVLATKEPIAHSIQVEEDAAAEYVPARHCAQKVEDETAYSPRVQVPETSLKPVVAQYEPATQAEHELEPVEA